MAKQRSTFWLIALAILWAALAFSQGYGLHSRGALLVVILTFGLSAFLAGMFLGQAVMQMRVNRAAKRPPETGAGGI